MATAALFTAGAVGVDEIETSPASARAAPAFRRRGREPGARADGRRPARRPRGG